MTLHATMTFAGTTTVKLDCSDVASGDTGFTFTTRNMSASQVASVITQ